MVSAKLLKILSCTELIQQNYKKRCQKMLAKSSFIPNLNLADFQKMFSVKQFHCDGKVFQIINKIRHAALSWGKCVGCLSKFAWSFQRYRFSFWKNQSRVEDFISNDTLCMLWNYDKTLLIGPYNQYSHCLTIYQIPYSR